MDFTKDIMKTKFETLLSQRDVKCNSVLLSREKYQKLIQEVKRAKVTQKKTPRIYWLLKHYDILDFEGEERLIVPMNNTNSFVIFYCSSDMLFDILYKTHLSIGHAGRDRMVKKLNTQYKNITHSDVQTFLNLCETCQHKRKSVQSRTKSSYLDSRCQIDLIDYESHPDGKYNFILVYQNLGTKFVVLKPLETQKADEIALVILDIFSLFESPCYMHSNNGTEFCIEIIKEIKALWPELKIVHDNELKQDNNLENVAEDIKNMLGTWMQDNNSSKWSLGLKFVQFMKNRTFRYGVKRNPYESTFGYVPQAQISTTSLQNIVSDRIRQFFFN